MHCNFIICSRILKLRLLWTEVATRVWCSFFFFTSLYTSFKLLTPTDIFRIHFISVILSFVCSSLLWSCLIDHQCIYSIHTVHLFVFFLVWQNGFYVYILIQWIYINCDETLDEGDTTQKGYIIWLNVENQISKKKKT